MFVFLAVELHEMNKTMRTLREQMEATFRRELVSYLMSYDIPFYYLSLFLNILLYIESNFTILFYI